MDFEAKVLILEDLTVETRGTRGVLTKAIKSMPDDIGLCARDVLAIRQVRNDRTTLVTLSPYGSSNTHVGCGGCGVLLVTSHFHHLLLRYSSVWRCFVQPLKCSVHPESVKESA